MSGPEITDFLITNLEENIKFLQSQLSQAKLLRQLQEGSPKESTAAATSGAKVKKDTETSDGAPAKKRKVEEDPNKPKPIYRSGYHMYCREVTNKFKEANPTTKQNEIMTLVGHSWSSSTPAEKMVYGDKYTAYRVEFDKELKAYKNTLGDANGTDGEKPAEAAKKPKNTKAAAAQQEEPAKAPAAKSAAPVKPKNAPKAATPASPAPIAAPVGKPAAAAKDGKGKTPARPAVVVPLIPGVNAPTTAAKAPPAKTVVKAPVSGKAQAAAVVDAAKDERKEGKKERKEQRRIKREEKQRRLSSMSCLSADSDGSGNESL